MENNQDATPPNFRDQIIAALKTIHDPEIPVDIYELGLIYDISVFEVIPKTYNVYVRMTLTSPSCPSAEQIPVDVDKSIKALPGVQDVQVELTFDPPYTPDMMSEAAKLELGFM
ncbi:MAG: DUF59 domain-containing protein [Cytophagales bacterium]|nr:MAG: DUF59 domain-containing protein [Cytophagales bacterium]TAF62563.1 MAG: DUF59 domain-containing protein [Cytophagales bacterium]